MYKYAVTEIHHVEEKKQPYFLQEIASEVF